MCYTVNMEVIENIEKIFQEKPLRIEYIETGLTNDNYIVKLRKFTVVIRIPKLENAGLFNYEHEAHVTELIEPLNLEPKLLYYSKDTGIKCSEYIENVETYAPQYVERVAILLRKLHDAQLKSGESFNIKETFELFKSRVKKPLFDTQFAHHYIDSIEIDNPVLCHNDLVQGNLLFSNTKDYLIDFEYAKDNDPFFDIMSFITENDITDTSTRDLFYLQYFGEYPDEKMLTKLHHYEIVHHVLWCEWAMMMYDAHQEDVYHEIASLKYQRLIECTRKKKSL